MADDARRDFRLLGKKHYSGSSCTATGCSNSSGKDKKHGIKRSYYTYPHSDPKRLKLWLEAIPRKEWVPSKHSCICSDHFAGGKKTNEVGSPGFVPTVFRGADKMRGKKESTPCSSRTSSYAGDSFLHIDVRKKQRPAQAGRPAAKPEVGVKSHAEVWEFTGHNYIKSKRTHIEANEDSTQDLEEENKDHIIKELHAEVAELKGSLVSPDTITDADYPVWTGLPNKAVFDALVKHLEPRAAKIKYWHGSGTMDHEHFLKVGSANKPGRERKQPFRNEFFLVLAKLRTGHSNRELSKIFRVSIAYISDLFTTMVLWLSVHLRNLFEMPDVEVGPGVPHCFKDYPNLAVVLDCTEVPLQKSSNLGPRKESYSNYKGRETLKFLVGLSPNQTVNYVSPAWGGRASDKHITMQSEDLLKALPPGCSVMTDRGFSISEEMAQLGVKLIIPCFKGRGRSQMSRSECLKSEHIAESRIHVERIIQRIRTYKILKEQAKLNMQNVLSEVFTCCAYLVNFQLPIVKSVTES